MLPWPYVKLTRNTLVMRHATNCLATLDAQDRTLIYFYKDWFAWLVLS